MENGQNNIEFIIHRGSHQIGGNCVELVSPNARILIDCGLPLDYDEQDPETQNEIRENARKWLQNCDAVFLSHYHGDHYGLLCEAPVGTKVFTSDETALLMELSGIFGEDLTQRLDVQTFENGVVTFKDFRVTQFTVDHSAYGASAFLFEVCGKSILYSGDIRLHGKKGILYKYLPQHIDYLFLEGTNLGRSVRQKTESAIENEFVKRFSSHQDSAHLVWCSSQNIDRMVALYRACIRSGRTLCIDLYTAYILEFAYSVHPTIPTAKTHPNLLIYYPNRLTSIMMDRDKHIIYGPYSKKKKMDVTDLCANPSKYVLVFRPKLLSDLKKHLSDIKVCLTNSIWAQYWMQDKPEINSLKAWIEEKPELRQKLPDIHTSGHADVASLQKIVEHVQPKRIIPIHTEHSECYSSLFPKETVMEVTDEVCYSMVDSTIWKSTKSFEDLEVGFYLTDLSPKKTGVNKTILVACKNPAFSPRIVLTNQIDWQRITKGETLDISLIKDPKVIEGDEREFPSELVDETKKWVVLNYELLVKYLECKIGSMELFDNVKKI